MELFGFLNKYDIKYTFSGSGNYSTLPLNKAP